MAKVKFKNKKSLQEAKNKLYKNVSFRRMKDGRKIAAKWPNRRKKSKK
jgi:hypothetical protein